MTSTALQPIDEVRGALTRMTPEFKKALPPHVSVEKFQRVVMTALQMTPALLQADRRTLFMAATRAAQTGLLPDGREGAIVSFGNQAQFMPMVAGIMKLVRNSGEISTWSVQTVHENDDFTCVFGDDERIEHKRALRNRGEIIGAYSIVTMKDGEKSREYMDIDEIEAIRKRSRSGNAGPWKTDYSEMAKKTVVRRHSKRLPMSTDLDGVLREDDELFMPPEPATEQAPAAADTGNQRRPSRLQKVVEQAPPPADDGYIDAETGEIPGGDAGGHDDSPI